MKTADDFLEGDIAGAAALMTMLASEARLQILCRLLEGERSVGDLAQVCTPSIARAKAKMRTCDRACGGSKVL